MQQTLSIAFPDWKFNATDLREENGEVRGVVQITSITSAATVGAGVLGVLSQLGVEVPSPSKN